MPLASDVRHSLRLLGRSPVFAITSVISLALGIGAAATIFSLTDALLFAPTTGVRDSASLIDIGRANNGSGFDNMSHPAYSYLHEHSQTTDLAAVDFGGGPMSLGDHGTSERVIGTLVSGNYLHVLGTRPALGRFFRADEDKVPGECPVVVLSHALWTRRFNGDPTILDRTLRLNNREFAVVGVAERGFQGSSLIGTDLWAPMAMMQVVRGAADASMLTDPRGVWHVAVGRMKPGVTIRQARAELNTLIESYKKDTPLANQNHTIAVAPMGRVPGPVRTPFLAFIGFLFALTGALLAIACSNVAGMLLARAATRRREMAPRLAVGAARSQLIRQLLTETLLLFVVAALVSLPLTYSLVSLLQSSLPALPISIVVNFTVNYRVMVFAFGIAMLTGLLFGLAPARHALSADLAPMLHGAKASGGQIQHRVRSALVAGQVALSLMLVVTALLFLRSLQKAAYTDPGFTTANTMIASTDVSLSGYRDQRAVEIADRFKERLRTLPGVESVATARMIPLQGSGFGLGSVRVPGKTGPFREGRFDSDWDVVSPEYFDTIGMKIVDGRAFSEADRIGTPRVAIISETLARRFFAGENPIGRRLNIFIGDPKGGPWEIVGVVGDIAMTSLDADIGPAVYVPHPQLPLGFMTLIVRTQQDPASLTSTVRAAVHGIDPELPLADVMTLREVVDATLARPRTIATLLTAFALMALVLAGVGVYGVMAYSVGQRTQEIGVRMALGATPRSVFRLVLGQAMWLIVMGLGAGLIAAMALTRLLQSLLYRTEPLDIATFATAVVVLTVVATLASYVPARRGTRVAPIEALRTE